MSLINKHKWKYLSFNPDNKLSTTSSTVAGIELTCVHECQLSATLDKRSTYSDPQPSPPPCSRPLTASSCAADIVLLRSRSFDCSMLSAAVGLSGCSCTKVSLQADQRVRSSRRTCSGIHVTAKVQKSGNLKETKQTIWSLRFISHVKQIASHVNPKRLTFPYVRCQTRACKPVTKLLWHQRETHFYWYK